MTGFGDAAAQHEGVNYAVELRSLNNRYFKASIRLPDDLSGLEPELETLLRKRVSRGSLTLTVTYKDTAAVSSHRINEDSLAQYLRQFETVQQATSGKAPITIDLGTLLSLPGVTQQPDRASVLEKARPIVRDLADKACAKMLTMRETEGRGVADDLIAHCGFIRERLDIVLDRAPRVVEEYHQRLHTRIDELLKRAQLEVERPDLIREVAIYAERSDISEEAQRLGAHLVHFGQIIDDAGDDAAGRRLDFLTQELLREANTIASKSNDAEISRTVVEIKGAIDRIKEQVQNVE
ncbi:MAG: YicC family protein [Phycisphaera sp.]|nr:YicC family protein [Phycisphaera sp.]